ncbi:MAG TPA: HAD family hydrolase [Candidatus Poseidoniales archaeon]|nr:HAD family hydrolase [Candidatus Poseidoniales archaeon]
MTKIKLVVFDMDGTLLQERSCWNHIHQHFGIDNKEMLQMYMEHKINDQEFAESDIRLWEQSSDVHINEAYINSILDEIEPIDGAEDLIQSLHQKGIQTVILSGGIKYLAVKWAEKWNMKEAIANHLIDDENGNLQVVIEASGHAKGPIMDALLERLNVSKDEVAAVGDTVVDIPLFERAGLGIAVNTNDQRVIDEADYHLKEKNLRNLIPVITKLVKN